MKQLRLPLSHKTALFRATKSRKRVQQSMKLPLAENTPLHVAAYSSCLVHTFLAVKPMNSNRLHWTGLRWTGFLSEFESTPER